MFIFQIHTVLMIEVIALVAGTALLMAAGKQECCKKFFKGVSYFAIIASILSMICTGYFTFRFSCSPHSQFRGPMMGGHEMPEGMGGMGGIRGGRGMELPKGHPFIPMKDHPPVETAPTPQGR